MLILLNLVNKLIQKGNNNIGDKVYFYSFFKLITWSNTNNI